MDAHDQELLDKQLARITPKRSDGLLILMFIVTLFSGLAIGGVLFSSEGALIRSYSTSVP
jgi:hypothetical protein